MSTIKYDRIPDEQLVKYLLGESSLSEAMAVEQWLKASEGNLTYFRSLRTIWETAAVEDPPRAEPIQSWERFRERVKEPSGAANTGGKPTPGWTWLAAAAVLLLLLSGAWLWATRTHRAPGLARNPQRQSAAAPWEAEAGNAPRTIRLPDGTDVTLNRFSSLLADKASSGYRLRGEAYFQVFKDARRGFSVATNDCTVQVLGTSFNLRSDSGQTEVTVSAGAIRVVRPGRKTGETADSTELSAGDQLLCSRDRTVFDRGVVTDRLYAYYLDGPLECNHTSLKQVAEVLNKVYDAHISLGSDSLQELHLTAPLPKDSLDLALRVISRTFNLIVTRDAHKILLH